MELSVLTARECGDDAIPAILELVDQEFLRSKGRTGTIATRYPSLFAPQNAANLYSAWYGRQLAGTVVIRKFDWLTGEGIWKGAMLGLVCVAPCFRLRGVGTTLIQRTIQRLEHQAVDFAVLWTTIPSFYERLGWCTSDRGVLGTLHGTVDTSRARKPPFDGDWRLLERIREKWLATRIPRTHLDYETLPASVRDVNRILVSASTEETAYALVGEAESTGVVYEMIGHPAAFRQLWQIISTAYLNLRVNDCEDSASYQWLRNHTAIDWNRQLQAMWLGLSTRTNSALFDRWDIPYFDRI